MLVQISDLLFCVCFSFSILVTLSNIWFAFVRVLLWSDRGLFTGGVWWSWLLIRWF